LLDGVFGYQSLPTAALEIFSLNPLICMNACEVGHLQAVLGDAILRLEYE
jgi:hypothetical protein